MSIDPVSKHRTNTIEIHFTQVKNLAACVALIENLFY